MSNQEQIEFWDGNAGNKWATFQTQMDAMLGPLGRAGIDHLAPETGAPVLDVGCGCGDTSLMLAERGAAVTGVDVSGPMLARARSRAQEAGLSISFEQADASSHVFDAPFAHMFSRFGVMFFANPAAAFGHIRSQLKSDGSLSFVCWRTPQENPWIALPTGVLFKHVPRPDAAPDPHAPGPFAFADKDRVAGLMREAGFGSVEVEALDMDLHVGKTVEEALGLTEEIGPASRLLAEQPQEVADRVKTELRALMSDYMTDTGVSMGAACWIVSAR